MMTMQQARQAIGEVGHKLFDEHTLDPYLQFASAEDEATYRRREEDRRQAYERELSKHTVEGDRRAAAIAGSQLADAKAHGAGDSPELSAMETKLNQATAGLQQAAPHVEETKSTEERAAATSRGSQPDQDLGDVLAALKASGIKTDALAANSDDGHGLTKGARRSAGSVSLP